MVGFLQEELRDLVGKIVMDSSATRVSPAKGGRAWELPGKGFSTLEGSGKEHLVEAAQDRLLENVVAGINQDTAQGKRIREQWTCAQASNLQVKEALRARNFPTQLPGLNASGHGRKATRDACEAFWPEKWCRVLDDDEILAELVVDCTINSIVDSFLDSAIELLDAHEGWALKSTGSGNLLTDRWAWVIHWWLVAGLQSAARRFSQTVLSCPARSILMCRLCTGTGPCATV